MQRSGGTSGSSSVGSQRLAGGAGGAKDGRGEGAADVSDELFGSLINLAGRQRMLSQRVVLYAALASLTYEGALATARTTLKTFEESHRILVHGSGKMPGAFFDAIREIYFGKPQLDAGVVKFIQRTHTALEAIERQRPEADAALRELVADSVGVLDGLVMATHVYEEEYKRRALALRKRLNGLMEDIKGIASQARIVAFNAQVVATRAGDSGKEFSAVATVLSGLTTEMNELVKVALSVAE